MKETKIDIVKRIFNEDLSPKHVQSADEIALFCPILFYLKNLQ